VRVLVTGASGFVGGHLLEQLARNGDEVVAWGSPSSEPGVDVRDERAVRERIGAARPDALVHLAGITHLPKVLEDPAAALDVNVGGALHVLEGVRRAAPRARVLLVSSGAVYGSPDPKSLPLDENAPLLSEHPYGIQKIGSRTWGTGSERTSG
jgi:GDP-4-dehydro-6-deoxy-D-mannose reductase